MYETDNCFLCKAVLSDDEKSTMPKVLCFRCIEKVFLTALEDKEHKTC